MSQPPEQPGQGPEPHDPGEPYQPPQPWSQPPGSQGARPQPGPPGGPAGQPWTGEQQPTAQYGQVPPYGSPAPYPGGPQPYGGPGAYGPPPRPGLGARLGPRLRARPEPRFGVSLAAVGVGIAIIGVLVWSFGYLGSGLHLHLTDNGVRADGADRRFLGAGLSAVVVVVGYALLVIVRRGPLATAGAIGAAIGVPLALIFLTLDFTGVFRGSFPANIDVVYLVSVLIWLISYFLVPGARGRAFFLGLAALNLTVYFQYKASGDSLLRATAITVTPTVGPTGSTGGSPFSQLSTGGAAAVGLIFGLAYYAIAFVLDRRGLRGVAVALVVAGFFSTLTGALYSAPSFEQVGTGVELFVLGAVLSWYGAWSRRRFTTWVWALAIVAGIALIVTKALPDSSTGSGIALTVVGLAVVAVAALIAQLVHESDDVPDPAAGAVGAPAPAYGPPPPGPGFGGP